MGIRKYKPTSPGRRDGSVLTYEEITRSTPEKSLLKPMKKTGGRNSHGHTTSRFRGGGSRRKYRIIDFKRNKDDIPARVDSIEYDPNRSCRIALLIYKDGEKRYILAPVDLKVGNEVVSSVKTEPLPGNAMEIQHVPPGIPVHNIELQPGSGAKIARSAGGMAQVMAKDKGYVQVMLPSGEIRKIHERCRVTIGQLGNIEHNLVNYGKAGRKRWMGRRPHVRGVAQNPVSHPMGGGEGRSAGGRHPCSPTGVLAKGGKTRKPHKQSDQMIVRRRKKRR